MATVKKATTAASEDLKKDVKKENVKAEAKPVAKEEVKAEAKPVAAKAEAKPVAAKTEAKPVAAKAETKTAGKTEEKPVVKAESKPTAAKAKKTESKAAAKAPAKRGRKPAAKKADVKESVSIQFSGKAYTTEELVKIAKDVWKYDLKKKVSDFESVELYVKPEESLVYYVINGDVTGNFAI